MTWFKVDDGFGEHAKVDALGADMAPALAVWLLCGTASARSLTDGVVTPAMLARSCLLLSARDRARGAAALVRVGLWHEVDGGWSFHDWHKYQPTRANVEAERECARERMANVRANKARSSENVRANNSRTSGEHSPKFERSSLYPSRPDPSRPDPSRPDPCESEAETGQPAESPAPMSSPEHTQGRTYVNGRLTLADTFRRAVEEHYKARQLAPPKECRDPMDKTWTDLAMWLHETRQARGWVDDAHNQARKTVEMFYSSTDPRTVAAKHDLSFLRKRPGQYIGIE